ncbi:Plasmodium exported protein, unknown function [Plasmodium malariae]|uniref:Uncharacterized protein n=1 Tax=Plasmodium malariae TaxID=5858 RepID=A0A1D3SM61_PLAMA|nr:Plasmodium exported protein, unknown function [Plasmodium malariae]SCO92894.1 Plasmodium exported protein, unknown function [Plasmodium malariae]
MYVKMIFFISVKTIIFMYFIWMYSYFCNKYNFDKILDIKNIENIALYARNYRLLSKFKKKKKKVSLAHNLRRNGYYYMRNKESNCEIENYDNNCKTEYYEKFKSKNKSNSRVEATKLLKKKICVLCKPFVKLDNMFEKLIYGGFAAIYKYRKCTDSIQKKSLKCSACKSAVLTFAVPSICFFTVLSLLLLVCPPLGKLVLGENSQYFHDFMTKCGIQAFLLSLFILSITVVIYILVKFINYVIEIGDEIEN